MAKGSIEVVLVESENTENIGRVCRVMKNFGLSTLVLIKPQCEVIGPKAEALASHAKDVLRKAKIGEFEVLDSYDHLIATTAILGKDSNVARLPLLPKDAAAMIAQMKGKIGIVFGRESSGLTNEELLRCDTLITIPTSRKYGTMNLSQAVGIVLYECFIAREQDHIASHIKMAERKDKDVLLGIINSAIDTMDFHTPQKKETQRRVWKRVVGKANLTKKEAMSLMGFFKKAAK